MRNVCTLLMVSLLASAASADDRIVWKASTGKSGVHHRPAAIARLSDGTLAAAGVVDSDTDHQTAAVWLLDANGRLIRQLPLLAGRDGVTVQDIRAAGATIFALVTSSEGAVLEQIDREGVEIVRADVGGSGERPEVLVPLASGGFLLTGRAEGDALIIAVDAKGSVQWKKRYDLGQHEAFAGGFEISGGVVLAGESRDAKKPLAGTAWIALIDPKSGEIVRERRWPGRDLRIAPLGEDALVAVVDRGFEFRQDVAVIRMSREFQTVWTTPIAREEPYRGAFHVAVPPGGPIHVAGSADIFARLWRIEPERGRVISSWSEQPTESRPWHLSADGLLLAPEGSYVLTTISGRRADGMRAWQIGVLRVTE